MGPTRNGQQGFHLLATPDRAHQAVKGRIRHQRSKDDGQEASATGEAGRHSRKITAKARWDYPSVFNALDKRKSNVMRETRVSRNQSSRGGQPGSSANNRAAEQRLKA
jgi:hypothetical protein